MDVPNRKLEKAVLATISIAFVIWSAAFIYRSSFIAIDGHRYFCLYDDAMISMRYAWNFSHGLGLVWNQGERIQGYSNLLMTLLMSLATLIFSKPIAPLVIQILGMGFMLAIAYISMKIADYILPDEDHKLHRLGRVLAFLCALLYYPLTYWSLMGMETGLLTLLLLSSILFTFHYTRNRDFSSLLLVSEFLGLAFLTRNDSIVFAIPIWIYIIWETYASAPKARGKVSRKLLAAISLYFIFIIGQLIFQYRYYGEILPNTYTLKLTGMPLLTRIGNGVGFIKPFLMEIIFILVPAGMELIFDFGKRKLLLFSIVLSAIGYQVYVGGDAMNYWRMMSPAMPLLVILFISAAKATILAISNTQAFNAYFLRTPIFPRKYVTEILITSLILIGLLSANIRFLPEISLLTKPFRTQPTINNVNVAILLGQLTTKDATIGVMAAGTVSYFTDRRAIDFLGKSDRYIAHLPPDLSGRIAWAGMTSVPGHNKYDLNYSIKTLKPTYVQRFDWGTQVLWGKINAP
jgi:arabinofuranosyltransferase